MEIKDIIQLISDHRFWIGPILVVGLLALLVIVFRGIWKNMSEEME